MKRLLKKNYLLLRNLSKFFILLLLVPLVYNAIPIQKGASSYYLSKSTPKTLIDTLQKSGYNVGFADQIVLYFIPLPKEGWHLLLDVPTSRFEFLHTLSHTQHELMKIKLYAGETHTELSKRLAKDLHLDAKKLKKSYEALTQFGEADIYAGEYHVPRDFKETSIIKLLYALSNDKFRHFKEENLPEEITSTTLKRHLTIASIIQKETNNKEEMFLVSSVIQNRLSKNMKLQMDATLNYGEYTHQVVTRQRIREDNSTYNTYKHKGIPPAPLSTVSLNALKASLYPADTSYLFFMLSRSGKHNFATTYQEHLKNIRAFKESNPKNKSEKKKSEAKEKSPKH